MKLLKNIFGFRAKMQHKQAIQISKILLCLLISLSLIIIAACGVSTDSPQSDSLPKSPPAQSQEEEVSSAQNQLKVHFIDVGQADSILIQTPEGKVMLIDAGNNEDGDFVVSYLKSQGVEKIDVLVGTHPHEDHIGGMDDVIYSFNIGKIYMPKVASTTRTYEDVLTAIKSKNLKVSTAKAGVTIDIDPKIKIEMLAPNSETYDDLNNYSAVIRITYGKTAFLFEGDAESLSEKEMLKKGYDLKADVLKIGHHGSSSSTTSEFLAAVSPKYAVISVGKNNDYGHPAKTTMDKLKNENIIVYRTDECGTITATSDGANVSFNCKPGTYNSGALSSSNSSISSSVSNINKSSTKSSEITVYWTPNGKSYHYSKECSTLSRSKTILSGPLSKCPKSDPCDVCVH
ncbi:hypothetical protein TSYNTROOL_09410 [Tepidanaerobacter syntrophicus]|nr:MBL fold metallo-hydrolase [Tepidanaerobacter syntrophicus]GLI50855.1 hypothetical protein TSYNTROOL_09410 [Tepidanaerobacter syntrophicus]